MAHVDLRRILEEVCEDARVGSNLELWSCANRIRLIVKCLGVPEQLIDTTLACVARIVRAAVTGDRILAGEAHASAESLVAALVIERARLN